MFAWLELRTHCHATEDQEKVAKALGFICPHARLTVARAEGYNRNPILVMIARTDSSRAIKDFWRLMHRESLVDAILGSGGKAVDDNGVLHLRLGKQEAYLGKAVLTDREDVVSVRIKIARFSPQKRNPLEIAKETIEELTKVDVSHT
jgi:RNA binding exosome subunit